MSSPELSERWETARNRFRSSMMLSTELHKLAQNIDASWPLRGEDETPEKYISFTLEELQMTPELGGRSERIETLITILEETLAFDDPFGEMAEYVDSSSKKDESAYQSLEKLGIPKDFPIGLTHLSPDTKSFCEGEDISDLNAFIEFSQNMAQNIVVGGDFKRLLNSLTHLDEATVREYIPARKGDEGVYLCESFGLLAKNLSPHEKKYLLSLFDLSIHSDEIKAARPLGKSETSRLLEKIESTGQERLEYFSAEAKTLRSLFKDEEQRQQERFFVSLNDTDTEAIAWAMASILCLGHPDSRKKGLFQRFFKS